MCVSLIVTVQFYNFWVFLSLKATYCIYQLHVGVNHGRKVIFPGTHFILQHTTKQRVSDAFDLKIILFQFVQKPYIELGLAVL